MRSCGRMKLPAAVLQKNRAVTVILAAVLLTGSVTGQALQPAPPLTNAGTPPPPPRQPLADLYLPPGRGYDWSRAGYREGQDPPSPPVAFDVVRDFGAVGDGVTNDTAALQAAIAAANGSPTGGVIYLPAGTYVLDRPLVISRSNVALRGAGEGQTTIYIPISLSDVYKGTWTIDSRGNIKSAWTWGGAFISFIGTHERSTNWRSVLASIKGNVALGATRIPVNSTAKFTVGQWVRIWVSQKPGAGRRRVLQAAAPTPGVSRHNGLTLISKAAPTWLRNDPVYRAAMAGLRAAGAEGEADEGLTPAQARAVDAAAAAAAAADEDSVTAAAVDGTIVAWIYGDNLADSGPNRSDDMDALEATMTAKVAAIGDSWIELDREVPFPVRYSWGALIQPYNPTVQEAGVEMLTVQFKHTIVAPHFGDRGYNAFQFRSVGHCWVRQVTVLDGDNAIFAESERSTYTDVTVDVTEPRYGPASGADMIKAQTNGHHPISIGQANSNLITRFNIAAKYIHDITVTSTSCLNVFSEGRGRDLNLDHHRTGPFGNLFTNIDMGTGLRPFQSGGASNKGANSGRGSTFWNLRATVSTPPPPPPSPRPPKPPPRPPPPRPPTPPPRPPRPPGPPPPSPPPPPRRRPPPVPRRATRVQSPPPPRPSRSTLPQNRPSPRLQTAHALQVQPPRPQPRSRRAARPVALRPPPKSVTHTAGNRRLLLAKELGQQTQQQQRWARRMAAAPSARPLALPSCDFGPYINYVGSYVGNQCANMRWLVLPLNASQPDNLHVAQKAAREAGFFRT